MNRRSVLATRLATALCLLLAADASSQEATVYHGFTRLDPVTATATEQAFVVVQGDRIASVGTMPGRTSTCRAATRDPASSTRIRTSRSDRSKSRSRMVHPRSASK
jgi:hypothetical protein